MPDLQSFNARMHSPEELVALLNGHNPENLESWQDHFLNLQKKGIILFGLMNNAKMIGITAISLTSEHAVFTGSRIDPDFRRQGLADQLYDTRKRYLSEIGFSGSVTADIHPDNLASRKAAERNGFAATQDYIGDHRVFVLQS